MNDGLSERSNLSHSTYAKRAPPCTVMYVIMEDKMGKQLGIKAMEVKKKKKKMMMMMNEMNKNVKEMKKREKRKKEMTAKQKQKIDHNTV